MIRHFVNEKGFTLMELLIAVSIVVILAGVGIPVYLKFQAGAKHAEASTSLNGIKLAEEAYKLANGVYKVCAQHPAAAPDENTQSWGAGNADFVALDFATNADVRFVYAVNTDDATSSFLAGALGDTDGDGNNILFVATEGTGPHVVTAADAALVAGLPIGAAADTAD